MSAKVGAHEDYRPKVCSVCGQNWMDGWNHSIWCGGFGGRPYGTPRLLVGPLPAASTRSVA